MNVDIRWLNICANIFLVYKCRLTWTHGSKRILFCTDFCNKSKIYTCMVVMHFESNRLSIAASLVLTSFNRHKFRSFSDNLNKLRKSLLLVFSSWFSTFIYFHHPYTEYKYRYSIFTIWLSVGEMKVIVMYVMKTKLIKTSK